MKWVICKTGERTKSLVQVEVKVGYDHPLTTDEAERWVERGEAYYTRRRRCSSLIDLRDEFARKQIIPRSVGMVYEIS